ncbi:TIGR03089 family protein [Fodinicola acaciae]|uniref:TIGR03089 family protein n=1 Tax=Fodinicola acaciae TaxID=2681555 RepID=UPI0013D3887C|nr:TIGR03089 family protein [Fodinicola acaciae]
MTPQTVPSLFAARVAADPGSPFLTYYDEATGLRIELSATTLDNWVSKTANLLVDGEGLGAGDQAAISGPPHWLHAAIALGAWTAGLSIGTPGEVTFAAETGPDGAYLFSPDSLTGSVADGLDFVTEVRTHGDHFAPVAPVGPTDPATPELSHAALVEAAGARAAAFELRAGARVLMAVHDQTPIAEWLLAPLAVGGSVVVVRNADDERLEKLAADEKVAAII